MAKKGSNTVDLWHGSTPNEENLEENSVCTIWCVKLWQNPAKYQFGHFLVENPDTGWKKIFLQVCSIGQKKKRNQNIFQIFEFLEFLKNALKMKN